MGFTAKLGFSQAGGGPTGAAGAALDTGIAAQPVTCSATLAGGVGPYTYSYDLLDAAAGSVLALAQFSAAATGVFTPDATGGCYRVRLTATDHDGLVAQDVRNFGVPDAYGVCLPSFRPEPGVDHTLDEYNVGGQGRGWAHWVDKSIAALKAQLGTGAGRDVRELVDAAATVVLATKRDTTIALSGLTADRSCTLPAAPGAGQIVTAAAAPDGSLGAHHYTLTGAGGYLVDGAASVSMGPGTNYGDGAARSVQFTGAGWHTIV